ncbi:MAG: AIR synthase-related protein [bacterium]
MESMTYAGSAGVNYALMDPFKLQAQLAARETDKEIKRFGFNVVEWTRGESAFLIETPWAYFGFVVEGLGTKSLVADAMRLAKDLKSLTGVTHYDKVAQCNAAMAFNDLCTVGAMPLVYGQYTAVGESEWFEDEQRAKDLIEGTKKACLQARCVWGGGETPTLKGIIVPGTVDLAGATFGIIPYNNRVINPARIKHGDVIVMIESSGIHANGLSLARKIAEKVKGGYLAKLPDSKTFGESLLEPTYIYSPLIEDCIDYGIDIHYAVNITGHGWRKLMRANEPFTYVIETLPHSLPIFEFMQEHGPVSDEEAYGNLNMGAGFALYVPQGDAEYIIENIAPMLGFRAFIAGHIEAGEKKVVIKPKGIVFEADTLAVR